ncbi:mitochondrial translation initiation factor 3 [Lycorma delicatula]|uniref:mitochondrial translation initiation factor 3 n=1 Tax=Lycorma delicatula TaxID=130591 RepID=UPI003F50ED45
MLFLQRVSSSVNVLYQTSYFRRNLFNINSNFHTSLRLSKTSVETVKQNVSKEGTVKPAKKKKEQLTYITLEDTNHSITVTTLEDATKLANRRDLKLIKVKEYDAKTERATYRLLTIAQYLREDMKIKHSFSEKNKSSIKGTKLVSLSTKISDNDLNSKIKNMIKWLDKHYEVRVVISNDKGEAENIYNKVAEGVKESGKIVQKRQKGPDLRFQIVALKKSSELPTSNSESSDQ